MNVLLVDDDKDFATGLAIFLEKFNIATVIEHRIASAEKLLRRLDFDVVLLDVMMPEGNGFDFLPKIRTICETPVIMLTALDEEDELVKGLDLGADDYITKPFRARELVARLHALNRRYTSNQTENKTVQDTTPKEAPAGTQPAGAPVELTVQDLGVLRSIIDVASQRGAFKANEMEAVGKTYNKLDSFLSAVQKAEEETKKANEAKDESKGDK